MPGIRVGHAHDLEAGTGCTVVLCEGGAVGGVDQRGGAPGTRETDALHPMHLVNQVHGVVLAGGSAFGLEAASGVVRYLEERGVGFDVGVARVPIVPAAILFDLGFGRADVRPDGRMGYQACQNASQGPVEEGNVGAGAGATVGKILGMGQAMKAGMGSASEIINDSLIVAALAVVNAFGDVIDPQDNKIIAGSRAPQSEGLKPGMPGYFANTLQVMKKLAMSSQSKFASQQNTVIGVVATNAQLNKEQTNKVAQMAQDGLARAIRPAHTMLDGDTIFALATGEVPADVNLVGACAAELFTQAILRAVYLAKSAKGIPGLAG
ncbi:MAG: P1 family peptidase [Chloroflexi bacterium]|nr:P1 family peptidase [Chloroflexota bacterium]